MSYRPQIDGLRFVLCVGVFLFHFSLSRFWYGAYGVFFFFTLSGFLITERLASRDPSAGLLPFYAGRLLRILPVYVFLVAVFACAGALPRWGWHLGFLSNWRFFWELRAASAGATLGYWPLSGIHFWSLAVELQFYLFYPLGFAATSPRRRIAGAVLALAWSVALRLGATHWLADRYYGLLTPICFEYMAWGALAALLARRGDLPPVVIRTALGLSIGLLGALAISTRPPAPVLSLQFQPGAWQSARGFGFALFILGIWQPYRSWPSRLLAWPPFAYLGRSSYSFYLVHPFTWPVFEWARGRWDLAAGLRLPITFSLSLALGLLLWWTIERPVARWRYREGTLEGIFSSKKRSGDPKRTVLT